MGAAAPEVDVVILDVEFAGADLGPGDLVEALVLDVDDAAAIEADEVMVLVDFGVEAGGGARVAGFGHEAEGDEGAEDAVDGHAGDLGKVVPDSAVKLLGRGMVGAVEDGFEDSLALGGNGKAAFAVSGEEAVHSLFFVSRTHGSGMRICTRW